MSTRNFLIASIIASAAFVKAQSIPEACTKVSNLVRQCVPSDATEQDILGPTIANCICKSGTFDDDLVECIREAGSILPEDYQAALQAFDGYCSIYGNGGGSNPNPTPTRSDNGGQTPTPTGSGTDSEYCNYFLDGISQCWTDNNPLPTAPPVARCLCSGGDFDVAVEGCYSDIVDSNPTGASTVAAFASFCSSYSAGLFDTTGGSNPTPTDGDSPTSRIIQTGNPTSTPDSNNGGDDDDNDEEDAPSAAGSIKAAAFGTSIVALLAGLALFL